jgi:branched-chain amino acid transport system substrate-binding protein
VTEWVREPSVTDTEIRIGNLVPPSGAQGNLRPDRERPGRVFRRDQRARRRNGRKIRFVSYDDLSDPSNVLDLTRVLVEIDSVLLMFGS